MEKPPHVLRMEVELNELRIRHEHLCHFILSSTSTFRDLAHEDQGLLHLQKAIMEIYAQTLEKRLARARPPS